MNRLTQVSRPISESDATIQSTFTYYEGLTARAVDPQSKQTTKVANVIGLVGRSIDHNGYYQSFDIDGFANAVRITDSASNTLQTTTYNLRGMRIASTDMDLANWSYMPNALGEVVSYDDAKGQHFVVQYDALSRPTMRTEPGLTTNWVWGNNPLAYNIGRLESVSAGAYSEAYLYDNKGRLATRTIASDTSYSYTAAYHASTGLIDTLTYPTSTSCYGLQLKYLYQSGLLQQVKDNLQGTVYWQGNAMNPRGQITQDTLGNGVITARSLDSVTGWVNSIQAGVGGGTALQNHSYLFDKVGNLTQRQHNALGLTENFYYDNLHRLDYSTLNGATNLDVTYDALGNITSRSDVNGGAAWTYDPVRKHAVRTAGLGNTYDYDANGNMTNRNGSTIDWTSYNYPSQINSTAETMQFAYDHNRQRYQQIHAGNAGTETTFYIGGLLEKTVLPDGAIDWRHYVYVGKKPIAIVSRMSTGVNSVRYMLADHLGSPATFTNNSGQAMVNQNFSAFGVGRNPATWSGSAPITDQAVLATISRRGFTFHTNLGATGLIHMNGRVYDSLNARFLSADPFIPNPNNTQSYNRYSYVHNSPLSFFDPSGFGDNSVEVTVVLINDPSTADLDPTDYVPLDMISEIVVSAGIEIKDAPGLNIPEPPSNLIGGGTPSGHRSEAGGRSGDGGSGNRDRDRPRQGTPTPGSVVLNFGAGATTGGAVLGGIVGATHAIEALTLLTGGNLLLVAGAASDVASMAMVGATLGAAAGVMLTGAFAVGYGIGTYGYNTFTNLYY